MDSQPLLPICCKASPFFNIIPSKLRTNHSLDQKSTNGICKGSKSKNILVFQVTTSQHYCYSINVNDSFDFLQRFKNVKAIFSSQAAVYSLPALALHRQDACFCCRVNWNLTIMVSSLTAFTTASPVQSSTS